MYLSLGVGVVVRCQGAHGLLKVDQHPSPDTFTPLQIIDEHVIVAEARRSYSGHDRLDGLTCLPLR